MKKLLLLRGAPASGKSTFIKDNNLEPYVISSDNLHVIDAVYWYETYCLPLVF